MIINENDVSGVATAKYFIMFYEAATHCPQSRFRDRVKHSRREGACRKYVL